MSESTILVVDDDPEILTFYEKIFAGSKRRDFDILGSPGPSHEADLGCLTFSDPGKLLEYYRGVAAAGARHPLCVVDMRMPTMNGLAVALGMREIDPEINIVISTAFSDVPVEEIRSKLREGVFFVRKPFVAEEFSLLIHSLVGHWNVRQELTCTQADLAAQFDKIGQVLEATRVGTWDWDMTTGKLEFSDRWAEMVGYTRGELEPFGLSPWRKLCHPDDLIRSDGMLEKVFAREVEYYDCECRMLHKGGDWIWVRDRGKVTAWSPGGKPLRMSGTHSDITQRKQQEEELQRAKHEADAANKAKSAFLAMMSHEIRTPLNGIIGATELLGATKLTEKQMEFVEMTLTSGHALLSTINDILDYTKIESAQIELEDTEFRLDQLVAGVIDIVTPAARKQGIDLAYNPDSTMPSSVHGDPMRLRQVLTNLAGNAVKFTEKGRVDISVASRPGGRIRFCVRDTGIGIPANRIADLFSPFTQADVSTSRKYGGTGLGLAISKNLVNLMGGELVVQSRLGEGSEFSFEIPLRAAGKAGSDGAPAELGASSKKQPATPQMEPLDLHVLLVEDNRLNKVIAENFLRALGISRLSFAQDGLEALDSLRQSAFDLIFMDCQMPRMDGYQATRSIRELEKSGELAGRRKIVGLSAAAIRGDRERAMEAGMDDYLTKPLRKQELADCIRRWT
jgi:PAS domain S-box-containing protein